MRRLLTKAGVLLCVAAAIPACSGDKGDDGAAGAPGASGSNGGSGSTAAGTGGSTVDAAVRSDFTMSPASIVLGRPATTVEIVALGDVDFTAAKTVAVDFGPEITVDASSVKKLNARTLSVSVSSTKNATVGFRDVKVTTDALKLQAPSQFEVRSPVQVRIVDGVPQQGGRVTLKVTNVDSTPFDPQTLRLLGGAGAEFAMFSELGPHSFESIEFSALIDAQATPGGLQVAAGNYTAQSVSACAVSVGNGGRTVAGAAADLFDCTNPPLVFSCQYNVWTKTCVPVTAETVFYSDPAAIPVKAVTPKAITPGTDLANETVADKLGTNVYKFSQPVGSLLDVAVVGTGTKAKPEYWLTSRSGKARELLKHEASNLTRTLLPFGSGTGDLFLIVGNSDGGAGDAATYGWKVQATPVPADAVAEQPGAHAVGSPQVVAQNGTKAIVLSGAISTPGEVDAYQINLGAPGTLSISATRKNYLGAVEVATDAAFTTNVTKLPVGEDVWHSQAQTSAQSQTWYVRAVGTDNADLTSYVLAIRPQ